MKTILHDIISETNTQNNIHTPTFFRLSKNEDKKKLEELLLNNSSIQVYDPIFSQLEELVKLLHPKIVFKKDQLQIAAKEYLGKQNPDEYGIWVYYPWAKRLVHILDEAEFVKVRTNRNLYKITPEERDSLATKKAGIIGLSVGQSVALSMAMERSFGELRIADFDVLELSNLNRIRSGLHNLNVPKVVCVAREIAEIDPFLKVVCYPDGITEENIDSFLLENGKLDLLIEECDGLYIKIFARQKARQYRIPVVMDTSDRGMVDIERFDIEPERPIFHGSLENLDISQVKKAKTNEEKVPFMLAIIGVETMSKRMKASLPEVEQSTTTWPQLASSVNMGGAFAADVYRRLMIGQNLPSGRFFIDLEDLIPAESPETSSQSKVESYVKDFGQPLEKTDLVKSLQELSLKNGHSLPISKEIIQTIVEAAIHAPSGGNCQPWKWLYTKTGHLVLYHDTYYSKSLLDYANTGSNIAFGAAIENLCLKASSLNIGIEYELFPLGLKSPVVACFRLVQNEVKAPAVLELANYIGSRHTNRNIEQRKTIAKEVLERLKKTVETVETADLILLDQENELQELADIVGAADRIRMLNEFGHYDLFKREIRWTPEEAYETKDGIDLDTMDMTLTERAGMFVAKDEATIELLRKWQLGRAFEKISRKTVLASSAMGIITMPDKKPSDYILAGQALQRVWLKATQEGIALQPQAPILFLFSRLFDGGGERLDNEEKIELKNLKAKFDNLTKLSTQKPIFMFRLCLAQEPKVKSFRKSITDILFFE